jgi:hypothetical protein
MPSLQWICDRVRRARAITVAAVGRWPEPVREAVLDAYREGAALVVFTAPGYDLELVNVFLDLLLAVRHSAVHTPGFLVLDRREGWLADTGLPLDRPRAAARALERAQVAQWVRFHGRIDHVDAGDHAFTVAGLPHVILRGSLPPESAVAGAFVRITALRSLALGQEAYHPHTLEVAEIVPRDRDEMVRRLDLAVGGVSGAAGERAPGWDVVLRRQGFAGWHDLETYLLDHGISREMIADAVAEFAPASPAAVASAMTLLVAGILQVRPPLAPLSTCTSILRAALGSASSEDVAGMLTAAAEALLDRASRGLWLAGATSTEEAARVSRLAGDLGTLGGEASGVTVVVLPAYERSPSPGPPASADQLAAVAEPSPDVVLAVDASARTKDVLARLARDGRFPVRIGLDTDLRDQVDLCLPRRVRWRIGGADESSPTLDLLVLVIRALRIGQEARLCELRRSPGPIGPRTGA